MAADLSPSIEAQDRALDGLLDVLAAELVERYLAELAEASHVGTAREVSP